MSGEVVLIVGIGPFLLSGAEVQQSLYVAGTPGPTAVAGVGHALVRRWRSQGCSEMKDRGTALLLEPIRETRGRARGMVASSYEPVPALPDEVRATFRGMLLVAISVEDDPISPPQEALGAMLAPGGWSSDLVGFRAFGGVILPQCGDSRIPIRVASQDPGGTWTRIVPRGRGFWLMGGVPDGVPDPELPSDISAWMRRPLARSLLRHMIWRERSGKEVGPWRRLVPYAGGIVRPAHVGYACLGAPEVRRPGRRGEGSYPHRFVEPVLGAVCWRRPSAEALVDAFWSHHRPSDGLFIVKAGNPAGNPAL